MMMMMMTYDDGVDDGVDDAMRSMMMMNDDE